MNANRIINMVIQIVLRKAVNAGVKAASQRVSKSRRSVDGHIPEG